MDYTYRTRAGGLRWPSGGARPVSGEPRDDPPRTSLQLEASRFERIYGFRAMTQSIAFRWGTPPEWETNSRCPESRICQSQ